MPFSLQDLRLAQEVPFACPIDGVEVAVRSRCAQTLGGDFHLFLKTTDSLIPGSNPERPHHIGFVVGDVAGKGLAASLISTSIGHLLPWLAPLHDPERAFDALNRELFERTPDESFTSMVLAETDTRTKVLRLWSAGHPPAILWRSAAGTVEIMASGNLPLGCFPTWQGAAEETQWEAGDILVLYSDGLIEARNGKGEMFGVSGIAETVQAYHDRSVEEIADLCLESARVWGAVTDDATVLVCRRCAGAIPSEQEPVPVAGPLPVRVLLVDDHAIWRNGMRSLLEDTEFEVVGEAASGREAPEAARKTKPDLILLDIRMAGGDGLEALAGIREAAPAAKILMLTTYDHPHYKVRAMAGGANGYLLKGMPQDEVLAALRNAVETAGADSKTLASIAKSASAVAGEIDAEELLAPLTHREVEVLRLLSGGLSNRAIGEILFVSEGTVKSHIEHIIAKLGVSDRVQAAVWAARHGLAPEIVLE